MKPRLFRPWETIALPILFVGLLAVAALRFPRGTEPLWLIIQLVR